MKTVIKIKAFTLLESLITLMLISVIIALSYALIDLIGRQLSVFEKENAEILEYNLFNSTFVNDIENAHDYYVDDNHVHLEYYNNSHIDYYINTDSVIRRQKASESMFNIHTIDVSSEIENKASNDRLEIKLRLLNDTISTNYFFRVNNAKQINAQLFNED